MENHLIIWILYINYYLIISCLFIFNIHCKLKMIFLKLFILKFNVHSFTFICLLFFSFFPIIFYYFLSHFFFYLSCFIAYLYVLNLTYRKTNKLRRKDLKIVFFSHFKWLLFLPIHFSSFYDYKTVPPKWLTPPPLFPSHFNPVRVDKKYYFSAAKIGLGGANSKRKQAV